MIQIAFETVMVLMAIYIAIGIETTVGIAILCFWAVSLSVSIYLEICKRRSK